jgi:NAD(P)-dependent dehydrogenase (short-subunit alcohol dehydrogenase family)
MIDWKPGEEDVATLKALIAERAETYRNEYVKYYQTWAAADSPKLRDSNPSIVVVPGVGIFGFSKSKKEARITTEFFINAIHVMAGANALADDEPPPQRYPQARTAEQSKQFNSFHNYVALPRMEAFRIEYWALEEAKLKRMPAEADFSRKILLVVGGGSGIGREVALLLAQKGAHVVVADQNDDAAKAVASEAASLSSPDFVAHAAIDIANKASIASAARFTLLQFGGLDGIINTAAIFPVGTCDGKLSESQWGKTFMVNVTGNYLLAQELGWILHDQQLPSTIVLTTSANAVVPKRGSEAYDLSKSAVSHLIRELAVGLAPLVRVNGIAPATVVAGSTMFPRDRVISSLRKYELEFDEDESTEELRNKLASFYAQRTLTRKPILPEDCAQAIVWLAGDASAKTTGHIIPVDGGLQEAFLR